MGTAPNRPAKTANPEIAPGFTVADWKALDLSAPSNADWQKAVDIFQARMRARFLAPVKAIRDHADSDVAEFSGFTIVAIDCLLIETLGQFYKGEDQTSGPHKDHFVAFFKGSKHFNAEFDTKEKGEIFYSHFRCGILHQAQTHKQSRVRYGVGRMVTLADPADVKQGLIIDRNLLHDALVAEIDDYIAKLRNPQDAADRKLRDMFKKKMRHVAK
jgi:hypothetical protein